MKNYLNTLISEKGINSYTEFEFTVNGETNFVPLAVIVEFIDSMPKEYQNKIKSQLVAIDFKNGDILHCIKYYGEMMCQMRSDRLNLNNELN